MTLFHGSLLTVLPQGIRIAPTPSFLKLLIRAMAPIVRTIAESGIQVVYAEPLSRHPPGLNRHRGIGLKKAGTETWEDLYDVKLFQLEWTVQAPEHLQAPGQTSGSVFLPRMGMPPREPTKEMMTLARAGKSFENTGWFIYASVMKAVDALPRDWITIGTSPPFYPRGDDLVISLPDVASGLQDSMKVVDPQTRNAVQKKFEFRTALPEEGSHPHQIVDLEHLYFIQLLPNELPSYHFFATPRDTPTARMGPFDNRIYTWFSRNANTLNPDSNRKQGLRETTPPIEANASSSASGRAASTTPGSSTRRPRSARSGPLLETSLDAKTGKTKPNPSKKKMDRSYKPGKEEDEEAQEVRLNKRKKVAEDAQLYRPNLDDDEEASKVKINKRKINVSKVSKACKPTKTRARASRR